MVEAITFNTAENVLTVIFQDGSTKNYPDRASYVADYSDREADCDAMGWE